eukprot:4459192-Prymnesium_polylepis.2
MSKISSTQSCMSTISSTQSCISPPSAPPPPSRRKPSSRASAAAFSGAGAPHGGDGGGVGGGAASGGFSMSIEPTSTLGAGGGTCWTRGLALSVLKCLKLLANELKLRAGPPLPKGSAPWQGHQATGACGSGAGGSLSSLRDMTCSAAGPCASGCASPSSSDSDDGSDAVRTPPASSGFDASSADASAPSVWPRG